MNDHTYFADRAEEESALGDRAANPGIAAIHYELAQRYALLSNEDHFNVIPILRRA